MAIRVGGGSCFSYLPVLCGVLGCSLVLGARWGCKWLVAWGRGRGKCAIARLSYVLAVLIYWGGGSYRLSVSGAVGHFSVLLLMI